MQYTREQLDRIGGRMRKPEIAHRILGEYLVARPAFRDSFPWLQFQAPVVEPGLDNVDEHAGVPASMPALTALALVGLLAGGSRSRRLIAGTALGTIALLSCFIYISQRYLIDFLPFLAVAGPLGLSRVTSLPGGRLRAISLGLVFASACWSLYCNAALCLVHQRETGRGTAEADRDRFIAMRLRIDRFTQPGKAPTLEFDPRADTLAPRVAGLELQVKRTGARYRFDGVRWTPAVGDKPLHRFDLIARFHRVPTADYISVLFAGKPGDSDSIWLQWRGIAGYRFCMDHWRFGNTCGEIVVLEPRRDYRFRIDMDRLNREVRVSVDGRKVYLRETPLHPWAESEVSFGDNPLHGFFGEKWPGTLTRVD